MYLLGQSVSIFSSQNLTLFFKGYLNVISYILLFIVTIVLVQTYNKKIIISKLFSFVYTVGFIVVTLELIMIFFFPIIQPYINPIIQREVMNAYYTDQARGRSWYIIHLELFIPFLFYALSEQKRKLLNGFLLILFLFISIFSNVRSRAIQVLFAVGISVWLIIRKSTSKKQLNYLYSSALIVCVVISALLVSKIINDHNVYERFVASENENDRATVQSRLDFYSLSLELFLSHPLTGVGLGNYINTDILNTGNASNYDRSTDYLGNYREEVAYSPHNIFMEILSETGILGITTFLMLLMFFIIDDFHTITISTVQKRVLFPYIISSWTVFVYTLFNPYNTIYIFGWFWFLRGVIQGVKT
jgi:O-antigen ligase